MSGIYKSGWGSFVAMNAPVNECEIESIEKVLYTIHMFPLLLAIGPVTIYTMSVFNVIAFFAAGYVYWQKGREEHYQEDELFDGFLLAFLWGLLWGRIGFIVLHFAHFGFQPLRWLDMFSAPGFVPLAGLIAGAWFLFTYAKKQKWNAFEVLDFAALAIVLSLAIAALGSFFDGSNFGNATTLPWGMNFPNVFDRRHPIQLYSLVLYVALFIYLFWVEGKYRTFEWYRDKRHSAQTGFLFAVFFIAYGLFGIVLSFFRSSQFVVFNYSLDLPIYFLLFVYGVVLLYWRSGRSFFGLKK